MVREFLLGEDLVLTISTESCVFKRKQLEASQILNRDHPAQSLLRSRHNDCCPSLHTRIQNICKKFKSSQEQVASINTTLDTVLYMACLHTAQLWMENTVLQWLQATELPALSTEGLDWGRIEGTAEEHANEETLIHTYWAL